VSNQFDLITLTVSPEEARMLATACVERSYHFKNEVHDLTIASKYLGLSGKIDKQRQL
jgi:hypothetical protein